VVPPADLVKASKDWIKGRRQAGGAMGRAGFRLPGGAVLFQGRDDDLPGRQTRHLPARDLRQLSGGARHLQMVYEGLQLPMDVALRVESRWFAKIVRSAGSGQHVSAPLFVSMQDPTGAAASGQRAAGRLEEDRRRRRRLHGRGQHRASFRRAGLQVVLIRPRSGNRRPRARPALHKALSDRVAKAAMKSAARDQLLSFITPSADYKALADLRPRHRGRVRGPQDKVGGHRQKSRRSSGDKAIFTSNTSTLPITSLALRVQGSARFIGIHFFSPVRPAMMLVELILGKETGDKALAARSITCAFHPQDADRRERLARLSTPPPWVGTYIREGHLMLAEGVPAA